MKPSEEVISNVVDAVPQRTWIVPDDGIQYYIGLHDFERKDMYYKGSYYNSSIEYNNLNGSCPRSISMRFRKNPPCSGLPETIYLPGEKKHGDFVPLPKEWQQFWFSLLDIASARTKTHDELIQAWADLTAQGVAFTDNHSVEYGFTDYILGKNPESDKGPIQHKSLSCGGNIFRYKGINNGGKYVVEALNLSEPPPDPEVAIKQNWLVHWATQETVLQQDGKWVVVDFPQLHPYGTPFLVVSRHGTNLIDPAMCSPKPIPNGQEYSPYIPRASNPDCNSES